MTYLVNVEELVAVEIMLKDWIMRFGVFAKVGTPPLKSGAENVDTVPKRYVVAVSLTLAVFM